MKNDNGRRHQLRRQVHHLHGAADETRQARARPSIPENCASCHGVEANGVPANGTAGAFPDLVGLGPATIDFWIDSGRMPDKDTSRRRGAASPAGARPPTRLWRSRRGSTRSSPSYPYIPTPNLKNANAADGAALFALNCAACHTIEGDGDALAYSTFAPSLRNIPAFQVAEAIRTGPGQHAALHRQPERPAGRRHRQVRHHRDPAPAEPRRVRARWPRPGRRRLRRTGSSAWASWPSSASGLESARERRGTPHAGITARSSRGRSAPAAGGQESRDRRARHRRPVPPWTPWRRRDSAPRTGSTRSPGSSAPPSARASSSSASGSSRGASTSCRAGPSSRSATRSPTREDDRDVASRRLSSSAAAASSSAARSWPACSAGDSASSASWRSFRCCAASARCPRARSSTPTGRRARIAVDQTGSTRQRGRTRHWFDPHRLPRGHENTDRGQAVDQTVLIRISNENFTTQKGRETWGPKGYVAYSKVCTHLGCPVGLYEQQLQLLVCPCHQSMFNVTNGAIPQFGPAPRPLPQLPLYIDADGYLRSQADYDQPVGPGFWERSKYERRRHPHEQARQAPGRRPLRQARQGHRRTRRSLGRRQGRAHLHGQDLPGPLVLHAGRDRAVLLRHPAGDGRLLDALLRAELDDRHLPRRVPASRRTEGHRGLRVHRQPLLRGARRAAHAPDAPLGVRHLRRLDRRAHGARLLHRAPSASRASSTGPSASRCSSSRS